jgi:hypothetical protein
VHRYLDHLGQQASSGNKKLGKAITNINEPLFALLTGVTLEE